MSTTKPSPDRRRITHSDGSTTALNDAGHVLGWTERGLCGWSAFWHSRSGDQRRWADTPEAAADLLFAGIAEEAQR
jgi:hypothetical protein